MDKAVVTCALNGVLTNPKQHHVPVTPEEMAREANERTLKEVAVMRARFDPAHDDARKKKRVWPVQI